MDDLKLAEWCQLRGVQVKPPTVAAGVQVVASERSFHPVRDYLDTLWPDGEARLDTWLTTYLRVENSPYTRAVGRAWMISAVARVRQPACKADHALILEGMQGVGKSKTARIIAVMTEWFADDIADLGTKDSAQDLRGKWIIELGELTALRRNEVERVKAFMSRSTDHYRSSYGRRSQDFPRLCVFIGSTNADIYLGDATGGRRFWPVKVGRIDLGALQRDIGQLWPEAGAAIRPTWLQQAVDELFTAEHLPEGPLLVLIEDATGSGKTEAGDLVVQRLIALGRAHGLYAALPTTATADAAFARKKEVIAKLYGSGADPQITLAHSRATTREALRIRYKTRAKMEKGDPGCLEWTAQSSKRALLADIGVGTIDRALLGALRTRHATVRLAGLYGKLLLVDEVHAYDDYMQGLLKRLLRHQASLGQHVALMSATLPSRMRETLVAAFIKGAGWSNLPAYRLPRERYPALHIVHRDGVIHREPEQPPEYRPAPVRFEPVYDEASVVGRIVAWSKAGRCVLCAVGSQYGGRGGACLRHPAGQAGCIC